MLFRSIFGYEAYGVALSKLSLGGQSQYEDRCSTELNQGSGGSVWGVPDHEGYLQPPKEEVPPWLPKEFLPQFKGSTYSIDMGMLLNGLENLDFLSILTNGLVIDGSGLTITIQLPIQSPLILPAWITYLEGTFVYNEDQAWFNHTRPQKWRTLIDLGDLGGIFRELNIYWDEGLRGPNAGPFRCTTCGSDMRDDGNGGVYRCVNEDCPVRQTYYANPYRLDNNMLGTWPSQAYQEMYTAEAIRPGEPEIAIGEDIVLPPITISITWGQLLDVLGFLLSDLDLIQLIINLIGGNPIYQMFPPYVWVTLIKDRWELFKLVDGMPWTNPIGGQLHTLLFPAFGYDFPITINHEEVTFNLMQMLSSFMKHPDNFYDDDIGKGYVSRAHQGFVDDWNDRHGITRWDPEPLFRLYPERLGWWPYD